MLGSSEFCWGGWVVPTVTQGDASLPAQGGPNLLSHRKNDAGGDSDQDVFQCVMAQVPSLAPIQSPE